MLKFTEYSSYSDWEDDKCKVMEKAETIYVSRSKIVLVKNTKVYRGKDHDADEMEGYVEKTLIVFDGNENYVTVNETVQEVLDIMAGG